jgi:uncharacterized membrane protein YdjX (TVP38/TMEM64 family)
MRAFVLCITRRSETCQAMTKSRRALLLHTLSIPLLALFVGIGARWLPLGDYALYVQGEVAAFGVVALMLYPVLFALCNVLLLPGGILAIGAGLCFGLWTGWACNVLGATLGAACALFLARRWGRVWVEKRLHGRWHKLDLAVAREGWKIIFLSQVHPLFPTSLLNYLYGLTRLPLRTCILWIALGQAPGMFLYAYLGRFAQSSLRAWKGTESLSKLDWSIWIIGLFLTLTITTVLSSVALRLLAECDESSKN